MTDLQKSTRHALPSSAVPSVHRLVAFAISRLVLAITRGRVECHEMNAIAKICETGSQLSLIRYRGTPTIRWCEQRQPLKREVLFSHSRFAFKMH